MISKNIKYIFSFHKLYNFIIYSIGKQLCHENKNYKNKNKS